MAKRKPEVLCLGKIILGLYVISQRLVRNSTVIPSYPTVGHVNDSLVKTFNCTNMLPFPSKSHGFVIVWLAESWGES